MKKYICNKVVNAEPAWRVSTMDYCMVNNNKPKVLLDGQTCEEGYCIHYAHGRVFCPKEEFEGAYHPLNNMTFGQAIEAAKKGYKITRRWYEKDMYVIYRTGYPNGIACNDSLINQRQANLIKKHQN